MNEHTFSLGISLPYLCRYHEDLEAQVNAMGAGLADTFKAERRRVVEAVIGEDVKSKRLREC